MSEPITRADLDMLMAAAIERVAKMTPAEREDMMEAQRQSWVRREQGLRRSAESASPPRVPVDGRDWSGMTTRPISAEEWARKNDAKIESGPGQPIDIDKARRVVNLWRDARGLDAPIPWETTLAGFIADALAAERRAGIAAAAQVCKRCADGWGERLVVDGNAARRDAAELLETRIRALAGKPAPDAARKGG